jgi:endonuclease G
MKLILSVLLFISFNAFADCSDMAPKGLPITTTKTSLICHKTYLVKYDPVCKIPAIVVEHLIPSEIGGTEPRVQFRPDPDLSSETRAELSDYVKSGYDRGHLAPAGDMKTDSTAMIESFYLSNIVPQAPKNNRGVWKRIEMRARALAVKYNGVYVISGSIIGSDLKIGNRVCVPTQLYKVIVNNNLSMGVAYLLPNTNEVGNRKISEFETTINTVEFTAKANLFPQLSIDETSKIGNFK